jgi:hypothetical protein
VIAATYRLALHLYPRSFRREYGDDMVALLEAQLRDEGTARVAARAVADLLVTVPLRHLEAHVSRASTTTVIAVLVALAGVLAVVGGPAGLVAAVAVVAVAGLTWSRSRPVVGGGDGRWWKLLLGGAGLFAALIAVTTATGELPSAGWLAAMVVGLTAIVLMATGLVLGIAARSRTT